MQGLISMVPQPQLSAKFQLLVQRAAVQDARDRAGKAVPSHMWASPYSVYLGFMYDALYTLVVTADAEISAGGIVSNGTALMARLLGGAPVDGMTGQVSFDTNGDSTVLWAGLNVQNRTMVPVLSYTPLLKKLATVAESSMLRPIVWPGNTLEVPVDCASLNTQTDPKHPIVISISLVLIGLAIAIVYFWAVGLPRILCRRKLMRCASLAFGPDSKSHSLQGCAELGMREHELRGFVEERVSRN
jgi:hypothetical protein